MEVIEEIPTNYYSCQVCQNPIKTNKEFVIEIGVSPLCSNKCLFMQYYKFLSKYPKEWLVYLAEVLIVPKISELNEQSLLFEVCKKYPKTTLSSINKEVTEKVTEKVTDFCNQNGYKVTTIPPLCNRGVVTCNYLPSISNINKEVTKKNLVTSLVTSLNSLQKVNCNQICNLK